MTMPRISDWLWIYDIHPRCRNDYKMKLRLMIDDDYSPEQREVQAFVDKVPFGVPRAWAMANRIAECENLTVLSDLCHPEASWPQFQGTYRKGQKEAVESIVHQFDVTSCLGGRYEAKAGSGKTVTSIAIASKLNTKTLVICHKEDLMSQWVAAAERFTPGNTVGIVQQDRWEYKDVNLCVASAPTLYSRRDRLPPDFKQSFGLVIFDESHRYAAEAFQTLLSAFPSRWRLGISATWRRRDGLSPLWDWHLGPLLHIGDSEHLLGQYVQMPIRVPFHEGNYTRYGRLNTAKLLTDICLFEDYNRWLGNQIVRAVNAGRKVLVVSDRLAQLDILHASLRSAEVDASLYIGSTSAEDREKAKDSQVILGTYAIFAEGTDVPALDTLFLASPRGEVEQVVGRIQRFCEGKKNPLVVDPIFSMNYFKALANKRRSLYHKLGFEKMENR